MKLVAILLSCLSLLGSVVPGVTQIVDAAEKTASVPAENHFQLDQVTIVESYELYKTFVKEVNRPEIKQQLLNQPDSAETKVLIQSLILKYDGAKVHYAYGDNTFARGLYDTTGWSEKFVNGGINDYATSKTGLANLRDYLGFCSVGLAVNGAGYGAVIGGVIGTVIGTIIGAAVLAKRCDQGQSDVKTMISKNRSNGGVRMTLTAEFPICSLTSQTQCSI